MKTKGRKNAIFAQRAKSAQMNEKKRDEMGETHRARDVETQRGAECEEMGVERIASCGAVAMRRART